MRWAGLFPELSYRALFNAPEQKYGLGVAVFIPSIMKIHFANKGFYFGFFFLKKGTFLARIGP